MLHSLEDLHSVVYSVAMIFDGVNYIVILFSCLQLHIIGDKISLSS